MDLTGTRVRRALATAIAVAALAVATSSAASSATAKPVAPTPVTHPGGLTPTQLRAQASTGFRPAAAKATAAVCGNGTIHCKPGYSGSCTGYSSQSTPPATIRVLVHTSSTKATIQAVPFETYVENVLPNEWVAGWDGDSLKAGAVAVKSYAWYWVTHYGGYVGSAATSADCFDVTDDTSFQVYRANSAQPRTTTAVQATWPYRLTQNGQVFQAGYAAYLSSSSEACGAHANGYQLSQWGSQNCVEANTGNKFPVILEAYYAGVQLATSRQLTTLHDFVYDQTSSKVTWDATTGNWSIDDGYPTTLRYGLPGDIPTVMTTGDGFARVGVFRPSNGTWYIGNATGRTAKTVPFGTKGDVPVQAQYNGAAQPTVIGVWRPSTGVWYLAAPNGSIGTRVVFGQRGDVPVPGHYSGGADQIAFFRPSTGYWWFAGGRTTHYGQTGDIPVPADYDGNGTTDLAVYRPSTHQFFVKGHAPVTWGLAGDIPVVGDFTGDGKADLAVYRPSDQRWFVHGQNSVAWGTAGAQPIGKAPYTD